MKIQHCYLIIFILIFNPLNGQDFSIKWQIKSLHNAFTARIFKTGPECSIMIKNNTANDSIKKRISHKDLETLISFLNSYDFPNKSNIIYGPIIRKYHETIILPDSNWILVNRDSIRRELLFAFGYKFDQRSGKCYSEQELRNIITDGTTYEGEYVISNSKRTYLFYSSRVSESDYRLNDLILKLMTKYDRKSDYSQLRKMIDSDKKL